MTPYFYWLSLLWHPNTPHFWWNVGSLIAQEATFCFNFINKLISFAIFYDFFVCKFLLLELTERSKVTFSPAMPRNFWTKIWLFTQWPLIGDCSHGMPQPLEVWALHKHPYPFDIGGPPRTIFSSRSSNFIKKLGNFAKKYMRAPFSMKIHLRAPTFMAIYQLTSRRPTHKPFSKGGGQIFEVKNGDQNWHNNAGCRACATQGGVWGA